MRSDMPTGYAQLIGNNPLAHEGCDAAHIEGSGNET
jgi:hypothetical protein